MAGQKIKTKSWKQFIHITHTDKSEHIANGIIFKATRMLVPKTLQNVYFIRVTVE